MNNLNNDMTETLASMFCMTEPFRDSVEGYRQTMLGQGYPDDIARSMAADYHKFIYALLINSLKPQEKQ